MIIIILSLTAMSCDSAGHKNTLSNDAAPLQGTWKLLSGTTVEKGVSAVTDYTKDKEFIKIINGTHFSFLSHDLKKGKDSPAVFSAGGGRYSLQDSLYTEHLEYCNDREWEGNTFEFIISIKDDTLVQKGIEKVANISVDRLNIEKYVRVKD